MADPDYQRIFEEAQQAADAPVPADDDGGKQDSAATKLIHMADRYELFHDATREAYATIPLNGHRETMRVASRLFRQHLALEFFKAEKKAPPPQALASALPTIEAKAISEGSRKSVHIRVAEIDGSLWLDLCNENWDTVCISRDGWSMVQDSPVKFIRPLAALPLPCPANGGSFRTVERFTTLRGDELTLLKGYILGCLRERGPFPILAFIGEQGGGKTTQSRAAKRMIDPSKAATRCLPKDERDLMIAAEGQHILALDNLNQIDGQMSDALCRLATGGGLSTRALYSDRDETIFEAQRPVILNAITDVLTRPDLIDRSIVLAVPALEESRRKPEEAFWADFDKAHPELLGALCDAASLALKETKGQVVPAVRMSDFAAFVERGEAGLGLRRGAFIAAYTNNRRETNEIAIDLSPVAQALKEFTKGNPGWSGTAAELLERLNPGATDDLRRSREWPKTPRGLSGAIRRVIPNLRSVGIAIKVNLREPGSGRRLISIECRDKPSQPSRPQPTVTAEPVQNATDTPLCDGRDGRDDILNLVTVAKPEKGKRKVVEAEV